MNLRDKKILIIAPHPDDEAICNGGLIMLAKKEKAKVYVIYVAIGQSRQFLTGQTNTATRIPEAKKAAKYGGFTFSILFEGEEFMRLDSIPQKNIIEKIEDVTKSFKPDIVVIPFRDSFDQDHRAVATACITAFRPIPATLQYQPKMILESEEPSVWNNSKPFEPNFYFNITSVLNKKIRLLSSHKTQLRKDPFPRSPDNLIRLAGMRGCEIGVQYAESYRMLRGQLI